MSSEKRITFISDDYYKKFEAENKKVYHTYNETSSQIFCNNPDILTTQMGLLEYGLFLRGYRIFIVSNDDSYELTLVHCDRYNNRGFTARDNLFELWKNGCFYKNKI